MAESESEQAEEEEGVEEYPGARDRARRRRLEPAHAAALAREAALRAAALAGMAAQRGAAAQRGDPARPAGHHGGSAGGDGTAAIPAAKTGVPRPRHCTSMTSGQRKNWNKRNQWNRVQTE